jgi:hypothetical protein
MSNWDMLIFFATVNRNIGHRRKNKKIKNPPFVGGIEYDRILLLTLKNPSEMEEAQPREVKNELRS